MEALSSELFGESEIKEEADEEPEIKINISLVDVYRNNYLNFDVDTLIDELWYLCNNIIQFSY